MAEEEVMDAVMWQARASACELLALSLRYPDDALTQVVASGEWADAACEIWGVLGKALPADWADGVGAPDVHDLRIEATRLFVGAPEPLCSPYEGCWRAEDDGVQPLLFVNPHSMEVERFCKACGLGRPEGSNEPLDHIATEFELLQFLASVAAGIATPCADGPAVDDFPGGSAEAAYEAFSVEHLAAFASRIAACMETEARVPFYRALGCLLASYLV